MGGKIITPDERKLVLECKSKAEFAEVYIRKFGMPSKMFRIDNIWNQRDTIRKEATSVKPPGSITSPARVKEWDDRDGIEVLVGISNKLSELIQLQKDMYALFKKLDKEAKPDEKSGSDNR